MKTFFLAASLFALASSYPIRREFIKREVPQEHSHNGIIATVRTSLQLNNPDGIVDPIFGLLGDAAAAGGLGKITNADCLQQATADQAFTNAKAAGDVAGQVAALQFRALERNTGKVGLASVACTAITAVNPEIAAISQHQDPASTGAAAINKAIVLELAKQIAAVGGDPQLALKTGTFAPGSTSDNTGKGNTCDVDEADEGTSDNTGKGNTCDVDEADEGCIFTQNLLVEDATAAEISAAVAGVAGATATAAASSASTAVAATSTSLGVSSTGVCSVPTATVTATVIVTVAFDLAQSVSEDRWPPGAIWDNSMSGNCRNCYFSTGRRPQRMLVTGKRPRSASAESASEQSSRKERRTEASASQVDSQTDDTPSKQSLAQLVDFSALVSESTIARQSASLAEALLWDYTLVLTHEDDSEEYEILELEFYLKKADCHNDPFAHGSEEQSASGNWYFHRAPTRSANPAKPSAAGGYRGGTRKGLDLTIAGPVTANVAGESGSLRGGFLLRTIRRISDEVVISGPSLLVDEVLRLTKSSNIATLVQTRLRGDTSALPASSSSSGSPSTSFHISPKPRAQNVKGPRIFSSSRIGLDLSNTSGTEARVKFISKPYRFFTRPHLLTSNGKGHTFHGLYRETVEACESEEDRLAEVIRLSGMKKQTAEKYLADYKLGLEKGKLASFIGLAGKGAAGSPSSYLKMMGVLDRLENLVEPVLS
ncbi:hypothetical protein HWV62_9177 [Athelia sp. TMB]|nr:hypothetical protein HWV62_9177 [Athelia sp. TMB]